MTQGMPGMSTSCPLLDREADTCHDHRRRHTDSEEGHTNSCHRIYLKRMSIVLVFSIREILSEPAENGSRSRFHFELESASIAYMHSHAINRLIY